MKFIKENWKDLLKVISAIAIVYLAVMSSWYSDNAEVKFWWVFWDVVSVVCILTLIIVWVLDWTKKR